MKTFEIKKTKDKSFLSVSAFLIFKNGVEVGTVDFRENGGQPVFFWSDKKAQEAYKQEAKVRFGHEAEPETELLESLI